MGTEDMNRLDNYMEIHPGYEEMKLIVGGGAEGAAFSESNSVVSGGLHIDLIAPSLDFVAETVPWLRQKEVVQHMGADFSDWSADELASRIDLESETKRMREIIEDEAAVNWYIRCGGKIIGNVNINSIQTQNGHKTGVMAILIGDPAYWGKKIARHVNRVVIDWAFSKGGFSTLKARIVAQNIGSIKSFESLDFKPVGTENEEAIGGRQIQWYLYEVQKEALGK